MTILLTDFGSLGESQRVQNSIPGKGIYEISLREGFGVRLVRINWIGRTINPLLPPQNRSIHIPKVVFDSLLPDPFDESDPPQREPREQPNFDHRYVDMRGWPAPCMWQEIDVDDGHRVRGGWEYGVYENGIPRALPIRIIWSNYAFDGFIALFAFLGILFVPGMMIRSVRRRRGRCPTCGYDLRGGPDRGCPECGWNRDRSELTGIE